jgi:polar amino acid transport system substrate-binding protein
MASTSDERHSKTSGKSMSRREFMSSAAILTGAAGVGLGALGLAAGPALAQSPSPAASPPAPTGSAVIDQIQRRGSLVVGMTLQFKPQMYRDEKTRQPAGYDVQMLNLMAADLKVKLEIKDQEFAGLIPALLAGQVDLVSVGLVGRPARALNMWFSDPYVPYQQVLLVPANSRASGPQDLDRAGNRITALTGSTAADLAKRLFPKATVVELEQQPAMLEVAAGRAAGSIVEAYLAVPFIKQNPRTKILNPSQPFALEFGAYGLPKGDVHWWMWVNSWLRYWKGKGVPQKLYNDIVGPTLGTVPVYREIPRY